jgi:hypothetical protein
MLRRLLDLIRRPRTANQPTATPADRDYAQEREDRRTAQLSDEDKAWGAASAQREQDQRARDQAPPVP